MVTVYHKVSPENFQPIFFSNSINKFIVKTHFNFILLNSLYMLFFDNTLFFFKLYFSNYLDSQLFFKNINSFFFKLFLPHYVYIHLKGIGFKLYKSTASNSLIVNSGYNHYTKFTSLSRPDVSFIVRKSYLLIFSYSKSISNFSNIIRKIRFPDPYRGKGFRFKNQILKFKIGKQR